jgi:NADPH:quinone reductase
MRDSIPSTMKAVMQDTANGRLFLAEVPVPCPSKSQVLVKMAAAPINPSDVSFLKGTYVERPQYPVIPGIEGSGTVVDAGGGLLATMRMGKRVTCSSTPGMGGTWAEYMITAATRVLPIRKSLSLEQGSMLIVNPMTALAFIDIARKGRHKAIVNNAAASVLGQMLIRLCQMEKIPLINIVRSDAQMNMLKSMGTQHVLNSSHKDYEDALGKLANSLNATLYFDAVAGSQTEVFLKVSPANSTVILYANLTGGPVEFEPRLLIQGNKHLESFYLGNWAANRSLVQTLMAARKVQQLAGSLLGSTVRKQYPLTAAQKALDDYTTNMTGGKVLFNMNMLND